MTLKEFNKQYQAYKDDFDLELLMTLKKITYKSLKERNQAQDEWF